MENIQFQQKNYKNIKTCYHKCETANNSQEVIMYCSSVQKYFI